MRLLPVAAQGEHKTQPCVNRSMGRVQGQGLFLQPPGSPQRGRLPAHADGRGAMHAGGCVQHRERLFTLPLHASPSSLVCAEWGLAEERAVGVPGWGHARCCLANGARLCSGSKDSRGSQKLLLPGPLPSVVLVLRVGDVHDGHQPALRPAAAPQPVGIRLAQHSQDVSLLEAQLPGRCGEMVAQGLHLPGEGAQGVSTGPGAGPAERLAGGAGGPPRPALSHASPAYLCLGQE